MPEITGLVGYAICSFGWSVIRAVAALGFESRRAHKEVSYRDLRNGHRDGSYDTRESNSRHGLLDRLGRHNRDRKSVV